MSEAIERWRHRPGLEQAMAAVFAVRAALIRLAPILLGLCAVFILGIALGSILPPGNFEYGPGLARHLLAADGVWYRDIAEHGYQWNPAVGTLQGRYQNVGFFPLYPLIERALMVLLGSRSWLATIAPGAIFGIWSIFAFDRLARRILPDDHAALRATALYAFWPAACFYFMGYPTGLINLCVIEAIAAYLDKNYTKASLWCGLGTAAAPTMVFVAAGLCFDRGCAWLRHDLAPRRIPSLIGFGLLSVWGLCLFMAYLDWRFGNPTVFVDAQQAWAPSESASVHVILMVLPVWYGIPAYQMVMLVWKIVSGPSIGYHYTLELLNAVFQKNIDVLAVALGIFVLFRVRKSQPLQAVWLTGFAVLLGYLWFTATTALSFVSGIRLLFPLLMMFIGLGAVRFKFRRGPVLLIAVFLVLACCELALVRAGYIVI